jgi:hypothetical protein
MPEAWDIEFYADDDGTEPVRDWLNSKQMEGPKQRAAIAAIEQILGTYGTDVCKTEWGKHLSDGLYELRIRHTAEEIARMFGEQGERDGTDDPAQPTEDEEDETGPDRSKGEILLRVYFTTQGRKLILLVAGYDKGRFGSGKREKRAIAQARQRVKAQNERVRRSKAKRRKSR